MRLFSLKSKEESGMVLLKMMIMEVLWLSPVRVQRVQRRRKAYNAPFHQNKRCSKRSVSLMLRIKTHRFELVLRAWLKVAKRCRVARIKWPLQMARKAIRSSAVFPGFTSLDPQRLGLCLYSYSHHLYTIYRVLVLNVN